jgi:hypothetical protein
MGPERPLPGHLAAGAVLSPSRITLENNGKIRPHPDRENAFARASGGGDGTGIQRSPRRDANCGTHSASGSATRAASGYLSGIMQFFDACPVAAHPPVCFGFANMNIPEDSDRAV